MNQETPFQFLYFSQLQGRRVVDLDGGAIGKLIDLIVTTEDVYPAVRAMLLRLRGGEIRVAGLPIPLLLAEKVHDPLPVDPDTLLPHEARSAEFLIHDLLLDKQIVDVQGAKVERVNDVHLLVTDRVRIVHVDVGFTGLVRRLGIGGLIAKLWKITGRSLKDELISWKYVQPLAEFEEPGLPIRLRIEQAEIRDLHPGELADIFEDLSKEERAAIVGSLGPESVADVLEEADEDVQEAVISQLDPEEAADILEEMDPGEAADILQRLPDAHSEEIIAEVEADERAQIEPLTDYEEESAAGLMTPEFVSVSPQSTVSETLDEVRRQAPEIEAIYYVYVLDEKKRLQGVTTLRTLFRSSDDQKVEEVMEKRLVTLSANQELEEVAEVFQKYSFLACPVVDKDDRMIGVILLKHAFDELLPEFRREGRT
jgi:CBS domain-containing protein/sporulation protein YlmC with PRC-barrel domain